ncbi:MAG TPA: FadR/GntR family transcriptional regulator [Streptosporangiaceae bacterium]|nr:FadR/GntR family transcriptional regulator [Streptosporangiaceae bacterium]
MEQGSVGRPSRPAKGGGDATAWRSIGTRDPLFLQVASQIERFITGNALSPGDRLPGERELCELLGVSRPSVREALRSLQTRGVLRVHHGKGVFVALPDEGERALQRLTRLREVGLDELFAMREVLEVPAAGWTAKAATEEQLGNLVRTFEDLEEAVLTSVPPRELQIIDARLHLQIAEYANNRFLAMTQTILQEMLTRSMDTTLAIPGRPARSVREHASIVEAVLARDAVNARNAARRHIRNAHRAALRRVASERVRLASPAPPI